MRLAELMRFAKENGIFDVEPQKPKLTENRTLLGKFTQGGFSQEEVNAAIRCGLIYEEKTNSYTHREGILTPQGAISALTQPVSVVETRYRYRVM
jgi:hypothetical protein